MKKLIPIPILLLVLVAFIAYGQKTIRPVAATGIAATDIDTTTEINDLTADDNFALIAGANDFIGVQTFNGTSFSIGQFATASGVLRLLEDTDNGANYGALTIPSALGGDRTYTFPDASGLVALHTTITNVYEFALSDETTAITTGTAKLTWRAPHALTVVSLRASLSTVSSSGTPTVDINEGGTTIISTKLTIDANEKTSTTAAAAYVLSDSAIADDAEITFDIDVAGTGATGLKVKIYYTR